MECQRCKSERVMQVNAHCSDCCSIAYKGNNYDGYVPNSIGIGGGDDVSIEFCLECGQLQGKFPIAEPEVGLKFR